MSKNISRAERRRVKRQMGQQKKVEGQRSTKYSFLMKGLLILIVIGIGVYWYTATLQKTPNHEVKVPTMNRDHTPNTEEVVYNSNPPTSGPHFSEWNKDWEFYESELPIGGLLHNMEHGGVVLFYQSSVDEATKTQLKHFTEDNFKIIASAHDDIPAPIALAAWGVYELFDSFDETGMKRFYRKNLNRAPENVYP